MTRGATQPTAPEFSRPFAVDEVGFEPVTVTLEATPDETVALAGRFDLVELRRLTAQVQVRWRERGRHLEVSGDLQADLVQTCVVSLEPVEAQIRDSFRAGFQRGLAPTAEVDLLLDPGDDDPPEPLDGPLLDLGELVSQHLSLAVDPYPRAPGVSLEGIQEVVESTPDADGPPEGPFGKLAALQQKRG